MRKTEKKRQRTRNEAIARRKVGRTLDEEDLHTAANIAIPDYVMRDFGSLEGPRDNPGVRRRAPEASEMSEDPARSHEVARENPPRKQ